VRSEDKDEFVTFNTFVLNLFKWRRVCDEEICGRLTFKERKCKYIIDQPCGDKMSLWHFNLVVFVGANSLVSGLWWVWEWERVCVNKIHTYLIFCQTVQLPQLQLFFESLDSPTFKKLNFLWGPKKKVCDVGYYIGMFQSTNWQHWTR
jgi:hypothetical protein